MRHPGLCVLCANLLHCCYPRTWPAHDHFSHSALYTPHSALHTPHFISSHLISSHLSSSHLISPHLSSSHLIPSLLRCHLSSSQLFSSHPITAQPFSSHRSSWKLISALLYVRKLLLSERSSSTQKDTKSVARRKLLHREFFRLRHRCVHTENLLAFPYGNLLHREAFADRIFYTQNLLHTEAFYTEALFFAPCMVINSFSVWVTHAMFGFQVSNGWAHPIFIPCNLTMPTALKGFNGRF